MDDSRKEEIAKYIRVLAFPVFILIFMSIITYSVINQILVESNIETMVEMSQHDKRILSNMLDTQWESLANIPETINRLNIDEDKDIIDCLQINNKMYDGNSTTMIVTSEGLCYQSDGLIVSKIKGYNTIKECDDSFAIVYDMVDDPVIEKRKEQLLVGIRLDDFVVGEKHFEYALRKININALDNELKIDSYGGKGLCSVVDEDGNFIVNMNRTGSVMERKNFFNMLADSNIKGYTDSDKLKEEISSSSDGVTFNAYMKDDSTLVNIADRSLKQKYLIHMEKLENTGWYYVAQVPVSVFSSLSGRIFGIVSILLLIIIISYVMMIWVRLKNSIKRDVENEVHRKQLSEALTMAQQASHAKTTFLSNMSHDIRTPMNAVMGFTSLAIKKIDDKEQVLSYLNKISQSSEHLRNLLDDILDMSRIESGKMEINKQKEDVRSIAYTNVNILQGAMDSKHINFSLSMDKVSNWYVMCDKMRLNQILMNLLSNAVKYTNDGGIIRCWISQDNVNAYGISVYEFGIQDDGIGMSEEFVKTIFDQFTREQTSTASGIQGTGLGMAITKNLVDMMGGTIVCHSKKNEGTEFIVRLPFKVVDESAATDNKTKTGKESANNTPEANISGAAKNNVEDTSISTNVAYGEDACVSTNATDDEVTSDYAADEKVIEKENVVNRVLLVDDNELNQEIVGEILKESDIEVDIVSNGKEACEELIARGAGYYKLVLMDVLMPVMNGYEAARTIRAFDDKELAQIPIIAMTANAFEEDKQEAIAAGMQGHIAKPIDIDVLTEEVVKYMR